MTREHIALTAVLIVLGAGWGVTQPLAKIAVSEGYRHFGLVFWQLAIGTVVLGTISAARGRGLPMGRPQVSLYLIVALLGTVLPNAASYEAARHLPGGWLSLMISTVPIVAFPIALLLGADRFGWGRLAGLIAGLAGVACLALPVQAWLTGTAAPDSLPPGALIWLLVALIPPIFYALESNYVATVGTAGLDPVQTLFGASLFGTVLAAPLAIGTGEWIDPLPPWGAPDAAIVLSSAIHALVYTTYVWLVGRAGAVFAVQVSYLVTGFGVLWSMAILGERYGSGFWLALVLMFAGLFLVQPRAKAPLAEPGLPRHDPLRSSTSAPDPSARTVNRRPHP